MPTGPLPQSRGCVLGACGYGWPSHAAAGRVSCVATSAPAAHPPSADIDQVVALSLAEELRGVAAQRGRDDLRGVAEAAHKTGTTPGVSHRAHLTLWNTKARGAQLMVSILRVESREHDELRRPTAVAVPAEHTRMALAMAHPCPLGTRSKNPSGSAPRRCPILVRPWRLLPWAGGNGGTRSARQRVSCTRRDAIR
jgi:hypothetical protein